MIVKGAIVHYDVRIIGIIIERIYDISIPRLVDNLAVMLIINIDARSGFTLFNQLWETKNSINWS